MISCANMLFIYLHMFGLGLLRHELWWRPEINVAAGQSCEFCFEGKLPCC